MVKVGLDGKIRAFFKDKVVMWISSCKQGENLSASLTKGPENQPTVFKIFVKETPKKDYKKINKTYIN